MGTLWFLNKFEIYLIRMGLTGGNLHWHDFNNKTYGIFRYFFQYVTKAALFEQTSHVASVRQRCIE